MSDGEVTESETAYDPTALEGVPEAGRARLAQNRAGLFTSDLSVNEFLLIKQAGFDPVGLVVGSSIYHVGIQVAGWKKSQELTVLSEAMYNARQLAMTRMEEEADQLGADGVVFATFDRQIAAIERDRNDAVGLAIHGQMLSFTRRDYQGGIHFLDRAIAVADRVQRRRCFGQRRQIRGFRDGEFVHRFIEIDQ